MTLLILILILNPISSIPTYALDVPTLLSPNDGTVTDPHDEDFQPLGIPEFNWSAVPDATKYRLQISKDIAFTTTIVNITTPNTFYTPTNAALFTDGPYFWRVRVEAPSPIGEYSGIWQFEKKWATDNNRPELKFPINGDVFNFFDESIFSWDPVMGAADYKLQIYTSSGGWATPVYTATTLTTTHQPKDKLPNGNYYWRVVPIDPGNHEGTPSEERYFTFNYNPSLLLLEPENGSEPTFTPSFRWTAVRGAEFYRLQYSTDPSFGTGVTQIDTRNTAYTPTNTLPNDVNYYWRVRVKSGNSLSDWTTPWTFVKRWYIKPILLTPTIGYQHQRFPFFSWTPVPGAGHYKIEVSRDVGFSQIYINATTSNTFYTPNSYNDRENENTSYWRVTPYDGNGKPGLVSNTHSYRSYRASLAPHQIYPFYYYLPNDYPGIEVVTKPYEDRTVPYPIFMWHRVYIPAGEENEGQIYAEAYRIQVSSDPYFNTVDWTVDTQNTVATPTVANPFMPTPGTDYFWRVRPLQDSVEAGEWSQVWNAQFNVDLGLQKKQNLELIRPTAGFEYVESTPLLEWFPLDGDPFYDVQISIDPDFAVENLVDEASVNYPAYAPTENMAQRSLGAVDFGIYYWRVRESGSSTWSEPQMFQIAAQSQWKYVRSLGDIENRLQIGSDPPDEVDVNDNFDLTSLHASQSSSDWFFGFHVPPLPTEDVTYVLYFDLDHKIGSGATSDALGYDIDLSNSVYQPEYAVYIFQEDGVFSANRVYLYRWNGIGWETYNILASIGGDLLHDGEYVELKIPNNFIGHQDNTGSFAITLLSFPAEGAGQPHDSVPSAPNIPGGNTITRFSNVSERLNLIFPPDDAGLDPSKFSSVPPFFWDSPIQAPISGVNLEAYLDSEYTSVVASRSSSSPIAYYSQTSYAWDVDIDGDNTYFWRIQPRYRVGSSLLNGAWSQGSRFEREGFEPQELSTSVAYATPTFSWNIVEGAQFYDLQVSTQENFGSTAINITTRQNSYTHTSTLANGKYYWRVRAHRNGNVINDWSQTEEFTLDLLSPKNLTPISGTVVDRAPTLCWEPIIDPVLAAWKYRVQVSKDPTFSTIFDTIDTEQNCWTPVKGYDDGQYYWRVAMIDGNNRLGNFNDDSIFIKQYPQTTLISPASGSTVAETPTFVWTPVDGAAKYKLEVSFYDTFSPTYDSITTNNTRYTPTKSYEPSIQYYWRVAMIDDDGKIGPFVGEKVYIDPHPYKLFLPMVIK